MFTQGHPNTPKALQQGIGQLRLGVLSLCLLILVLLPLGVRAENAPPFITSTAYWEDTTAQATLEQAQQQTYTPYQNIFNKGFTKSAHWLRLDLRATDTATSLYTSPIWVDEITLYDPAQPGQIFNAGDNNPKGVNVSKTLGYTFTLPANSHPRTLWLRLQSTSAHRMDIRAVSHADLNALEALNNTWAALYAALLVLMLLALISIWWLQPEKVLGTYLIRHSWYTVYAVSYLGLPSLLTAQSAVPAGVMDIGFSLLVSGTLTIGLWFDITLLRTYNPNPFLLKLLKLLAYAGLLGPILVLTGQARSGLSFVATGLMLATLLVFMTALSTRPRTEVQTLMSKNVMLAYYTLILGGLFLGLLNLRGWISPNNWSQHLLILHGLVSGLMMTVLLFIRGQRHYRHHQITLLQLRQAQQETQLEQQRREEQSKFLHMLMHELKTPLSVAALALGTQQKREENLHHAQRAIHDMKAIIDRCVQADRLGNVTLIQEVQNVDLPALVQKQIQRSTSTVDRVQMHVVRQLPTMKVDRQLLDVIIKNLMDNALRYSDPVTPIALTLQNQTRGQQAGLNLRIANTPGLAGWPDEARIFDKYYRSPGANRDSGSGLGLYLSRQLAQSMGGTLNYQPSTHQVEFVLWLPLSPA